MNQKIKSVGLSLFLIGLLCACHEHEKLIKGKSKLDSESHSSGWEELIGLGDSDHAGQVIIQTSNQAGAQARPYYMIMGNVSDENFDHVKHGDLEIDVFSFAQTTNDEWNSSEDFANIIGSSHDVKIYDVTNSNVDYVVNMYFPETLEGHFPEELDADSVITWNSDANNARGLILSMYRNVGAIGQSLSGGVEQAYIYIADDDGSYTLTTSDMDFFEADDEYSRLTLFRGDFAKAKHSSKPDTCSFFNITNITGTIPLK